LSSSPRISHSGQTTGASGADTVASAIIHVTDACGAGATPWPERTPWAPGVGPSAMPGLLGSPAREREKRREASPPQTSSFDHHAPLMLEDHRAWHGQLPMPRW